MSLQGLLTETVRRMQAIERRVGRLETAVFPAGLLDCGYAELSSQITLGNTLQTILTVTRTVPGGTLAIVGRAEYLVNTLTATQFLVGTLDVDGAQVNASHVSVSFAGERRESTLFWIGHVDAGSLEWRIRARKFTASNEVVADSRTALMWLLFG